MHGEVVCLDQVGGFGFVRTPNGEEYYFGRDNLTSGQFSKLSVGTTVQFIGEVAGEGLQAKRVSLGKHDFG